MNTDQTAEDFCCWLQTLHRVVKSLSKVIDLIIFFYNMCAQITMYFDYNVLHYVQKYKMLGFVVVEM